MDKKIFLVIKIHNKKLEWRTHKMVELTPEELELLKNHLKWNDTNPLLIKRLGTLEQRITLLKKLEMLK